MMEHNYSLQAKWWWRFKFSKEKGSLWVKQVPKIYPLGNKCWLPHVTIVGSASKAWTDI